MMKLESVGPAGVAAPEMGREAGRWPARWVGVALLLLAAGCGVSDTVAPLPDPATSAAAGSGVGRTEVERGPVKLTVEVDPQAARLSDEPVLTLTIDYEREVQIDKPPFGEAIGDFIIRDYREPLPEVKGGRETVRQIYELEPTRTGTLQIAPIRMTFTDSRPGGDGKKHAIETEAMAVEISSVVASEAVSLDDLQGQAGPMELPAGRSPAIGWLAGLLLLGTALLLVVWFRRRRRTTEEETQLSPRELAYLELEALIEQDLAEVDVKLFYVHLTGIVRRFIERDMQIRAPEQTTEEFLREISSGKVFAREDQQRLKSFLESSDIVKFAAHHPTPDDVEEAFNRAKVFVGLERDRAAATERTPSPVTA
jgi:hypothetical protein